MSDAGGSGGGGVLYKRIPPPPPEPQDYGPRLPTSPSYECYPEFGNTTDHAPPDDDDGYNLNALRLDDGHDNYDYLADRDPNTYECGFGSMPDHTPDGYGFKTPDRCSDGYDDYMDQSPNYSDDCAFTGAGLERQTNLYATAALDYYNGQDQNQKRPEKTRTKYELVQAITSAAIFSPRGFYGHVNFTAKSNLDNSKEEFLFAELYYDSDSDVYKPTCIVSLQGRERVGGVRGIESACVYYGNEIPVDPQHCYACLEEVKHPKDGALYESGHHVGGLYGYL